MLILTALETIKISCSCPRKTLIGKKENLIRCFRGRTLLDIARRLSTTIINIQEANFVSCRLGEIVKEGLQSPNLKYLFLRNNLIQVIQGRAILYEGLNGFPNLVEL